ncbi:MAG: gliding motility-associated C-terminal domain-containing protein [Terrimonas ferruginea]|nr:gliding motility-associated C-terminal domain-containing protein [Terrimonas ferruginea]
METGPGDTLCVGQSTRLSASGADSYTWSPSAGLSSTSSPRPQANPTTTTTYRVIGRDNDNCFADTADILVKVHSIPQVEAGPDQTLAVGSAVQLRATGSADVTVWRWSPAYNLTCIDCPAPSASPRQTTKYVIDVTNEGGCSARDELTVYVVCNNGNLFVPNTFSPNGNGMNEVFYPRGKGLQKIRSFRVFNRWGELVFEAQNFNANDAAAGWDGTYRGKKLAPDVFVYSIEVVCENNEILSYKGDVTLLR